MGHELLPMVLPAGWQTVRTTDDGAMYMSRDGMSVIVSWHKEDDGRHWLHVSCARKNRLPSWDDVADVKRMFVGDGRYAYQVIPPKSKHVNIHPNCLHLWAPLEGAQPLPDFTHGGNTI